MTNTYVTFTSDIKIVFAMGDIGVRAELAFLDGVGAENLLAGELFELKGQL